MPALTLWFSNREYERLVKLSQETQVPRGTLCRAALKPMLNSDGSDTSKKAEPPKP